MKDKNFLKYYKKLNPEQKKAVDTIEGPVMVIAGPGTGKTQILAMRIANILKKTQVNPSNILCLTFTNSATNTMRKRLLEIIGLLSYRIHVHTFHSFCNEVINLYPEKFLIAKRLNQLTDLEQIQYIQEILNKNDFELIKPFKSPHHYQKTILDKIAKLKQEAVEPDEFFKTVEDKIKTFELKDDLYHEKGKYKNEMKGEYKVIQTQLKKNLELAKTYQDYQKKLETEGKYDYTDMILFVLNAFKNEPEILSQYQEKFQYILVDEYQDTNSAQNKIVELLGSFYDDPNIFVVGDDEQSIFRFQGASMENILSFTQKYPQTKIIVLKENYRSGQKILDASRDIIRHNQNQIFNKLHIQKNLHSSFEKEGKIYLSKFFSGKAEDYFIAQKIQEHLKNGAKPSEIAVLYKEHRDAENLINFLSKLNIPYKLEAGGNILDDPEIKKIH